MLRTQAERACLILVCVYGRLDAMVTAVTWVLGLQTETRMERFAYCRDGIYVGYKEVELRVSK